MCALRDRRKSLAVLTEELNTFRKFHVSQTVCRRALHSLSLFGRVAARKPLLSLQNVKKASLFQKTCLVVKKKVEQSTIHRRIKV
jgi:hypothetical protein